MSISTLIQSIRAMSLTHKQEQLVIAAYEDEGLDAALAVAEDFQGENEHYLRRTHSHHFEEAFA